MTASLNFRTLLLTASLSIGLASAAPAAEEQTINAFSAWTGKGFMVQTGPNEKTFVGSIGGRMYVDTEKGPVDAGEMICPITLKLNMQNGSQEATGKCTVAGNDGALLSLDMTCTGIYMVGCSGKSTIASGTGRFAGVTGGGKDSITNTFDIAVSAANDAPYFTGLSAKTILEDATTNNTAVVTVIDTDTASSNLVVTAASSDTNLVTVAITTTNLVSTTNGAYTLTFSPLTNAYGSATITVVANDGALSTTNSFLLSVSAVNDLPAFAVSTNLVLAAEDAGAITNASFLTGISTGPTNESAQTWTFTVTSGTNFAWATAPAISTNGTLTFRTATNAIGTNLITVVMKDNGGITGGGKDSVTNTFSIGVTPVNETVAVVTARRRRSGEGTAPRAWVDGSPDSALRARPAAARPRRDERCRHRSGRARRRPRVRGLQTCRRDRRCAKARRQSRCASSRANPRACRSPGCGRHG